MSDRKKPKSAEDDLFHQLSLLERLGGTQVVETAVDKWLELVAGDHQLRELLVGVDLPRLKDRQALLFRQVLAGASIHRRVHPPLADAQRACDLVIRHLRHALSALGVPKPLVDETASALGPIAAECVVHESPCLEGATAPTRNRYL